MKIIDNDTIESDFERARLSPELQSIAEFARWVWRIRKYPLAVVIIVWAFLFLVLGLANAFTQTQQRPLTAQHTKDGRVGCPTLKRRNDANANPGNDR